MSDFPLRQVTSKFEEPTLDLRLYKPEVVVHNVVDFSMEELENLGEDGLYLFCLVNHVMVVVV